jgi:glycyl-tRNA synthetase beta chain
MPPVAEFLLEIGCEEIPAPWLPGLTLELRERFSELAAKEHLEPTKIETQATPRRLALRSYVAPRQADREEDVWGPSLGVAKDASGGWTKAAQGFARKNGVAADELRAAPKDPAAPEQLYLLFKRRIAGRDAASVLSELIGPCLRGLSFPKRMSWGAWLDDGKGELAFGRPIRWLVALLEGSVVPFRIFALEHGRRGPVVVESGNASFGHRFLPRGIAGRAFQVRTFEDLRAGLHEHCVVLDRRERRALIERALGEDGHAAAEHHGLLEEWTDLVEYPTVVFGAIPPAFQSLPREVLETVLVHHQKYVPLLGEGRVSRFAAVTNIDAAAGPQVVRGMQRVVVARLRDAAFFFREDLKRPLSERVADLRGVSFHQKLGSYADKGDRLVRLIDAMGPEMGALGESAHASAREAARLAKADLTTLMVREFPELQGVMGAIYLRARGGSAAVASAVRWHYHPLAIDEKSAPAGELSGEEAAAFSAVSVADKLDTLAGYFGIGLAPSGSSDPYGLRRAAQGVVRVLLDFWDGQGAQRPPSLRRLIAAAVAGYGAALPRPAGQLSADVEAFLLDRLRYVLVARGFAQDEVEAVLGAREPDALDDPREALIRAQALHRARSEAREDFEHLAVAFKRAKNILSEGKAQTVTGAHISETKLYPPAVMVNPEWFEADAERDLFSAVTQLRGADADYETSLRSLAALRAPVDRFFDDVLVMTDDARLRGNRLGLLSLLLSLFYRIADISKLGG